MLRYHRHEESIVSRRPFFNERNYEFRMREQKTKRSLESGGLIASGCVRIIEQWERKKYKTVWEENKKKTVTEQSINLSGIKTNISQGKNSDSDRLESHDLMPGSFLS